MWDVVWEQAQEELFRTFILKSFIRPEMKRGAKLDFRSDLSGAAGSNQTKSDENLS